MLANLPNNEGDVVLLFAWIELANVRDNGVNQGCRRECAMTVQGFDQATIAELFAGIIEGFGCAVGVKNQCIAGKKLPFFKSAIPFVEQAEDGGGRVETLE